MSESYPPWPAIICDEEMLPQTLLNTRPVTTKQADGSYRESYADGRMRRPSLSCSWRRINYGSSLLAFTSLGLREHILLRIALKLTKRFFFSNTDLTPLDIETCKDVSEKSKTKPLLAAENHDL
ncbi:hypothetical protein V8E54_009376 [Elaphomyces granulatus]